MARKPTAAVLRARISGERAGRLYKLLKLLNAGPVSRTQLLRKSKVGLRTFYRDVDLLRGCGVEIEVQDGGYVLNDELDLVLDQLPFPDPQFTFGEVQVLMKGRSTSQQRLRQLFGRLTK